MKNFNELRAKMSPEALAKAAARKEELIRNLPLDELRAARRFTQQQLAETLEIDQSAVSKLERRTDMYITTLRKFVEAMGGSLEIYANFPDGRVLIDQFRKVEEPAAKG